MARGRGFEERLMLREFAQTVPCRSCMAAVGEPCVSSVNGRATEYVDHPRRLADALAARDGHVITPDGHVDARTGAPGVSLPASPPQRLSGPLSPPSPGRTPDAH
jgi:hypothetical protein